jgi:Zn-dependent protease
MPFQLIIFQVVVLIFSVIIHEISHGFMAERLGDPTARMAGRLTLNPLRHLDIFGSFIVPLTLAFTSGIAIGWAKPVPYNPYNLKDPHRGGALIAAAGPAANLFVALVFGLIIRFADRGFLPLDSGLVNLFEIVVYINILLGIFNLLPIPPIDGSKVITVLFPHSLRVSWEAFWARIQRIIAENLFVFLILLFLTLQYIIGFIFYLILPVMEFLFVLLVGHGPNF